MSDDQGQLFDATRYSPVSVAIWQRLPESNARAFAIASALGSYRLPRGSSAPLRSGREAVGSYVNARRLKAVLAALDVSPRQWRRYVGEWIGLFVAHRCERGTVFLFTKPEFEACANCGELLKFDHVPDRAKRTKAARNTANGRNTTADADVTPPRSGASTATREGRVPPQSERKSAHPSDGSLLGLEVGVPALEVSEEALLTGISTRAPRGEIEGDTP